MDIKSMSIDALGMSVRSTNALHRARVFTVEELLRLREEDLISIRNIGRKSIDEIMDKIRDCSEWEKTGKWPIHPLNISDDSAETEKLTKETVKNQNLQDTELSVRAINALQSAGIHTVGEMLALTMSDLSRIKNIGVTTINDIFEKSDKYRRMIASLPDGATPVTAGTNDSIENYEQWLADKNNQDRVIAYLQKADISIEVLDVLSVKAYNILMFAGYTKLYQIVFLENDIDNIPRMDSLTANEIRRNCRYYLREKKDEILAGVGAVKSHEQSNASLSVYDMMKQPEYMETILQYVKMNDLDFQQMNLSARAYKRLSECGYHYLSDIILKEKAVFLQLSRLGNTSVEEIMGKIHDYIEKHQQRIVAYVNGDTSVLVDEDATRNNILIIYQNIGFKGLHLPEIIERLSLPETIDESVVKKVIGRLIAEGKLEYIDYLVYRVYPSYRSYLDKYDEDENRGVRCVRLKMQGQTLESIAQNEGLTRERIRQIIKKADRQIRGQYLAETGMSWFDEDYYRHLYINYDVDRKVCTEWFGIPVETYNFLDIFNSKGKKNIAEALDDPELDVGLKLKIKNYLNRDKILIEGNWIEKKRSSLEEYVLMKYCSDGMSFDDFTEAYNNFLASQGIPYTEKLYYTESVIHTRVNRLTDSRFVLWKQFQKLRYYDIDARDYSELLDTLNLDSYENTEISTLKFMEDYPDVMARYDIRDQYELHNLLKKIIPEGSYHDFHCGRMPEIIFGSFNRDDAILELLINNAPISQVDLINIIHDEFGYSKLVIGEMLDCIKDYYHMGMYSIDYKVMLSSHKAVLQSVLTEDFYYIDEIKQIYEKLVPDADLETVNPYNLKSMGFITLSRYVLQHWPSLEAYFRHLLRGDEIMDITQLRKRFGNIVSFSGTYMALKNNYEILEFERNQIISFKKLERSGVTKQMFKDFCNKVWEYMEDETYFSAKSLCQTGFESPLYDLGFSDWFYANLLCCDARFSYCDMLGTIILYKGKEIVSIKSFLTDQIRRVGKIDIADLINDLNENFGCSVKIKSDITGKLQGSEIYYDPILERLYANAELYYRELDEDPEDMVI